MVESKLLEAKPRQGLGPTGAAEWRERRLSAILAADVAGYSRLMHNDEEATHAKLTALLADAVAPAIAEHRGRIVKNTGDGFLAEFPSAVEAVRAAMRFQARTDELTIDDAEDRRIAFRVGINIGDVIAEPHDIFGDAVNIAARLENIAEPSGIYISSSAYDQVLGKIRGEFADLGEQNLKNIPRPVRAYAVVRCGSCAKAKRSFGSRAPGETQMRKISLVAAIALMLAGVGVWATSTTQARLDAHLAQSNPSQIMMGARHLPVAHYDDYSLEFH
jgi:class 3 adenylate cyclase